MNTERTLQGGAGRRIAREYKTELSMLAIFAVFFVVLSFASPYFLTTKNIMNVMSQVSSTALLAIGMTIGLGYGDNARAALMTRGLAEITRLGVALGAEPYTFLGLTGVGDLFVTCTSEHSRNRRAGIMLGKGQKLDDVLANMGMVVEGVSTTKAAYALAKERHIEMPILEQMYHVLFEDGDVNACTKTLMTRSKKGEHDDFEKKDSIGMK